MLYVDEQIEICVSDIESAKEAILGGANSLELCSNRIEGGITPSIGFVEECVQLFKMKSVEINVLVRPRPGDFCYTSNEFTTIIRDIEASRRAGATGF